MKFPLDFNNISVWLALTSIILLVTSELISPQFNDTGFIFEKRRLKKIAFIWGILFLFTAVMRIFYIIINL